MTRPINADTLKEFIERAYRPLCDDYHMKDYVLDQILTDIENEPTIDTVPVTELKDTEKERDYWMDMAHSYEQTILRLTISASDTTAEPVRHGKWIEKSTGGEHFACRPE